MGKFKCSKCLKEHKYLTKIEAQYPSILSDIPASEKEKQIVSNHFFHLIDKKKLVTKGALFLRTLNNIFLDIETIVWVQTTRSDFDFMVNNTNESDEFSALPAKLISKIPYYYDFPNSTVEVELIYPLNKVTTYPQVRVINASTPIWEVTENGVAKQKLYKVLENKYHSKDYFI